MIVSRAKRWWPSSYRTQLSLFLVPYLLGTLILVVLPALATVAVAFTKYNSVGAPQWVGLANFRELLYAPLVRQSLWNTFIFVILAVPTRIGTAFLLALLLRGRGRLPSLYRASVYLPTIIPEAAYALVWLWIFNPVSGPLNVLLTAIGLTPPDWLIAPTTARLAIVIMMAFQCGEGFLVLLAGLQQIPRSYYEAAMMEGANTWQTFRHITLPLIMPWLVVLTFRDMLVSVQMTFTPSFILTYGGPYYATTFIPLLIYELAFDFFDFGLAAALLVLLYLIMALMIAVILRLLNIEGADAIQN
jgi:multiple sugar transport system permease protein